MAELNPEKDFSQIPEEKLQELVEFYKVFGDITRIRIISLLSKGEYGVSEISKELGINPSAISHQLKILRQARLVKYKRNGKAILYTLDDQHVENIYKEGIRHIVEV